MFSRIRAWFHSQWRQHSLIEVSAGPEGKLELILLFCECGKVFWYDKRLEGAHGSYNVQLPNGRWISTEVQCGKPRNTVGEELVKESAAAPEKL